MARYFQDPEVRQPLPQNYDYYQEKLFIQPDKGLTTLNSDNNCGYVELIDPNNELRGYSNSTITGEAHPRTRIAPIIPPRPTDRYWKDTPMDWGSISIVNKRRQQYPALAGYNTQDLTDLQCLQPDIRQSLGTQTLASPLVQTLQPGVYTLPTTYDPINTDFNIDEVTQFEPIQQDRPVGNVIFRGREEPQAPTAPDKPTTPAGPAESKETYEPIRSQDQPKPTKLTKPMKIASRTPDSPSTSRENSPRREPIHGREAGSSSYSKPPIEDDVSIYNVFDPRFTGYGSDNRNYLDPVLRQPRYFYDDVNAIRMPNYLVRSKIDSCVTVFGDQYGPMRADQKTLNQIRPLAEQAYLNNNLNFRNDLMESLMRKRNSELWQTRSAPMYTTRQSLK